MTGIQNAIVEYFGEMEVDVSHNRADGDDEGYLLVKDDDNPIEIHIDCHDPRFDGKVRVQLMESESAVLIDPEVLDPADPAFFDNLYRATIGRSNRLWLKVQMHAEDMEKRCPKKWRKHPLTKYLAKEIAMARVIRREQP